MNERGVILVTPRSFRSTDGPHREMLEQSPYTVLPSPREERLLTEEEMIELVSTHRVRAIIVGLDPVTQGVIREASELRIISKYGTGLDNIDLEAARSADVTVTYTPGANTPSVADLAMGLMLGLARRIPTQDRMLRSGRLDRKQGVEIWNKTLGIVGLGQIGGAVARRAEGFQMEVLYHDVAPKDLHETLLTVEFRPLEDLLEASDFVSLHCGLNPATREIIGADQLARMPSGSFLINTARKELVDETALLRALRRGDIAGAGLDTFDTEDDLESELLGLDNVIGTPHSGAATQESVLRMARMATREVLEVLGGKSPQHPVEPPG